MKPARPDDLPKATHEGAVIHADDFHKILAAMGMTEEDWSELAAALQ